MHRFSLPAGVIDFPDLPDKQKELDDVWNDPTPSGRFMAAFTAGAACGSENYVDPRIEPPSGAASPIPWNGFPRLLSRFYGNEQSDAAKARAEKTADVLTEVFFWYDLVSGRLRETPVHQLSFYIEAGTPGAQFAAPLREILANGQIGDPIPMFRRQQDEYLEWHASHDTSGRLEKVAFTVEPPEYWEALALVSKERVLKRYKELVGEQVKEVDLFFQTDVAITAIDESGRNVWVTLYRAGDYNRLNKWTTTDGIVHLTHRANTLGAEVNLAADASVLRVSDLNAQGVPDSGVIDEIERMGCAQYGGINRSSDPLIGKVVGKAVADGHRVTLTDPVGLYVGTIAIDGLRGPNPNQAVGRNALKIVRGQDDLTEPRILRFEVELPDGLAFKLHECVIDGRTLKRGGQIARLVTMQLYANLYPGTAAQRPAPCRGMECRHPDNPDLLSFNLVDRQERPVCPDANHPVWLLRTPDDGSGSPPNIGAAPPSPAADSVTDAEALGAVVGPMALSVSGRSDGEM